MPDPCVLVVDDEHQIREVFGLILEASGFRVALASDGAEAIEHLRGGLRPCLILLDLMMPGMNGWQFLAERDESLRAIPVVLVSGNGSVSAAARETGASGFLAKPVEMDGLLATVNRFCCQPGGA